MARQVRVIAIDGPVAAGKTQVGRELARRLNFRYLDTGVMYRAITWLALKRATPMEDGAALGRLAHRSPMRLEGLDGDRVLVGELDAGPELWDPEVERHVSLVSRVAEVRRALVLQQRRLASAGNIVVVGRDIGTVVLPDADLKIFLMAPLEERAQRRWRELVTRGSTADFQAVLQETRDRDDLDTSRADSPLKPADDAWLVDTGSLSADEVVGLILERVHQLGLADRAWA